MQFATIHSHHHHCGWDARREPVLRVTTGKEVELEILEASGGKIGPGSTREDLRKLTPETANPTTGPVYVEGARPGDWLEVEVLGLALSNWGWTALIPGFGLLAEDFPEPWLRISRIQGGVIDFGDGLEMPARPFPGTLGVAPAEDEPLPSIPPHRCGGNLDCRDLVAGTRLFLPVEVEGALFSAGDTHAAQGDGEVCGTAIESPMRLQVRFQVHRGGGRGGIHYLHRSISGENDGGGCHSTCAVGPDSEQCARDAVRRMVDWLVAEHHMDPCVAYALCSINGHLRIAQFVNVPNFTVVFTFPLAVF